MKRIIHLAYSNPLFANVIFFGLIVFSIFIWFVISKEEMPEFESNWVRVSTFYPGASAEDVETFVSKPIEEELKTVNGIEDIFTSSSQNSSLIRITLDDSQNLSEVVDNIKNAILNVELPNEVRSLPSVRHFKSSEKAIIDIGLFLKNEKDLTTLKREHLQSLVLNLKEQLLALETVSSIDTSYYLKPEIQIEVDLNKKLESQISLTEIEKQIKNNNIRYPLGTLEDKELSKVVITNELESISSLNNLILRGNYSGDVLKLSEISKISKAFKKTETIFKINGHEGLILNIRKNNKTDIISARKSIVELINKFKKSKKSQKLGLVLLDDESYAVRNRIKIITTNAIIGFVLIIIILFLFLDSHSGLWVAMGIPFSIAFTLVFSYFLDQSINNMTLAGIIIILGVVVDDAIIVAENIARKFSSGQGADQAAIEGASEVANPILASILTTCVAFLPLYYFEGFFGKLVKYIPLMIFLMLSGSLVESIFILPRHLIHKKINNKKENRKSWFQNVEKKYRQLLLLIFEFKTTVIILFSILFFISAYLFKTKMNYVMFPREEAREVLFKIKTPEFFNKYQTSKAIEPIEKFLSKDLKNIVGLRTSIALSRRGGQVSENEATIMVEVKPKDSRNVSLDKLIKNWKEQSSSIKNITELKIFKGRWGHSSGSPIEIEVLENNDSIREKVVNEIITNLERIKGLKDIETNTPIKKREYVIKLNQINLFKNEVAPQNIASTLRTFFEGTILYSSLKGNEEVDIRLTVAPDYKKDIQTIEKLRVENNSKNLAFLKNMIELNEVKRPISILRSQFKRVTTIYADFDDNSTWTPLSIGEYIENNIFSKVLLNNETTIVGFQGEISDSRKGIGQFLYSILAVIFIIYLILVITFKSLLTPLVILIIIPFSASGVIYALLLNSINLIGFFGVIGALGMIGVVVNDSIIMVHRIKTKAEKNKLTTNQLANMVTTRLRPIIVTTLTTVAGLLPTAYGIAGHDSLLAEMMLTMSWGLIYGTFVTLILIPCLYSYKAKKNE